MVIKHEETLWLPSVTQWQESHLQYSISDFIVNLLLEVHICNEKKSTLRRDVRKIIDSRFPDYPMTGHPEEFLFLLHHSTTFLIIKEQRPTFYSFYS